MSLALVKESVLNIAKLLGHLDVDATLAGKTGLALDVEGLGDAENLVSNLLLAALLGLVTALLLAGKVLTEVDACLVNLLGDLGLEGAALVGLVLDLVVHALLEVLNVLVELVEVVEVIALTSN